MELGTRKELREWISKNPELDPVYREVRSHFKSDPSHDFSHLERVAVWTIRLGEGKLNPVAAVLAALFHDWVNLPKNHPDRARASELSAFESLPYLERVGLEPDDRRDVFDAIRTHSFSRGEKPVSLLGRALQDADRLEALGALGLYRCIATGVQMGSVLCDFEDVWAKDRPLNDQKYMVDHFYVKLFKLPETMGTTAGKAEALKRVARLQNFLDALGEELGG